MSTFNIRFKEALSKIDPEELKNGSITLTESIKSDFFDMYRILASPYQKELDLQSLLEDRVDRLYDYFLDILYKVIVFRATHASAFIEDDTGPLYGMHQFFSNNYVRLVNIKDTDERVTFVRKHASKFMRDGSWSDILKTFYDMIASKDHNPHSKAMVLDRFFGLTHNNGSIIEYFHLLADPSGAEVPEYRIPLNIGWLEDALYLRALSDFNTLGDHSSTEVRNATTTAAHGLSKDLVDPAHIRDIKISKNQRFEEL